MSQNQRSPEAFRSPQLFERGMGYVVVSRFKGSGRVELGVFLVDTYCLGVKDAFFTRTESLADYEKVLDQIFPEGREEMPAAAARKLVEQAVAYANGLGLAPAADYKKGARVFGGIHAEDWPEDFTFGKDGKPFFINGPNDTPARCQQIIGALERSCGPGNFDYTMVSDFEDEEFEEWDEDELEEEEETEEDKARISADLAAMAERRRKDNPNVLILPPRSGIPKLSERLKEVVEPLMYEGIELQEVKGIFSMAAIAWNYPSMSWVLKLKTKTNIGVKLGADGVGMLKSLVARRRELFPDDRRIVADVEVSQSGPTKFDVRVASVVDPKDPRESAELPEE